MPKTPPQNPTNRSEEWEELRRKLIDEANSVFDQMRRSVEEGLKRGQKEFDIIEVARKAKLDVPQEVLDRFQLPRQIIAHPFLSWDEWFPWRPLWSYYWSIDFPGSEPARIFQTAATPQSDLRSADVGRIMIMEPCP